MEPSSNSSTGSVEGGPASAGSPKETDGGKQQLAEPSDSLRYAIFLIDKKIRNLEKKKTKVEKYAVDRKEGKELNDDQVRAVSRLDETLYTLASTRDLKKQFEETLDELIRHQHEEVELDEQKELVDGGGGDQESRMAQMVETLCLDRILQYLGKREAQRSGAVRHLLAERFAEDGSLPNVSARDTLLQELSLFSLSHYYDRHRWISDDNWTVPAWLFDLIEGSGKPAFEGKQEEVTCALAKASLMNSRGHLRDIFLKDPFPDEGAEKSVDRDKRPSQTVNRPASHDRVQSSGESGVVHGDVERGHALARETSVGRNEFGSNASNSYDIRLQAADEPNERTDQRKSPPSAVRSLTFTNRNYTLQQMNPQPMFDFDPLIMSSLDLYDEEAPDEGCTQSPVTFMPSRSKAYEAASKRGFDSIYTPQHSVNLQRQIADMYERYQPSAGQRPSADELNAFFLQGMGGEQRLPNPHHPQQQQQQRVQPGMPFAAPSSSAAFTAAQMAAALYSPEQQKALLAQRMMPPSKQAAGHIPNLGPHPYPLTSALTMTPDICQNMPFEPRVGISRGSRGPRFHRQPMRGSEDQHGGRRMHYMQGAQQQRNNASNQDSQRNY